MTLFRKRLLVDDDTSESVVDFWDTAGQESFNRMHPSYYYKVKKGLGTGIKKKRLL